MCKIGRTSATSSSFGLACIKAVIVADMEVSGMERMLQFCENCTLIPSSSHGEFYVVEHLNEAQLRTPFCYWQWLQIFLFPAVLGPIQ